MCDRSFRGRLHQLGVRILFSSDTYVALASFFIIGYLSSWNVDAMVAAPILEVFTTISATFFSIVLAGLAIVVSFTDKEFILAWKRIKEFDNILTVFQWNLYIPLFVLMISLLLRFVHYDPILMVFSASLFIYMVCSLFELVKFITTYGLQRGDFLEAKNGRTEEKPQDTHQKEEVIQTTWKMYALGGLGALLFAVYLSGVKRYVVDIALCDAIFGISIAIFSIGLLVWVKKELFKAG